jgi:Rrf2 family transcriptional regulator, nitric oxide-sensitive transcriptional repressor
MSLSLQTDYSLRVLLFLAMRRERTQITQISDFYSISRDHVAKVVNALAKLGYIRSIRGLGGGLEIKTAPESIKIGEIITHFEGGMHLLECVNTENVCVIQPTCKLRHVLAEAERLQMEYLNSITLADLIPTAVAPSLVTLQIVPPT